MDYYCRKYNFSQPEVEIEHQRVRGGQIWDAAMFVDGRRIGLGSGRTKKDAKISCYLDVAQYLEKCDRSLWEAFVAAAKTGKALGLAQPVTFHLSERLEDDIQDICSYMRRSRLYQNKPAAATSTMRTNVDPSSNGVWRPTGEGMLRNKSEQLRRRLQAYLTDKIHEQIRRERHSLPVFTRADDILKHVSENEVTICMAETGSGKTTQIPQIILDDYINRGEGARCNIFCTQPRRLAAISVAHRVARERGEPFGRGSSIGYHVRFESKLPDERGSITFCTIGVFLRRLQNALQGGDRVLDSVTHIIVDEAHERDIDTDLLLVVLKRLLRDRRAKGKSLKVILMSATIDASLFQSYFPDEQGVPAKVVEVPGRSFPVDKHYLDDFLPELMKQAVAPRWVFRDEKVVKYLHREIGPNVMSVIASSCGINSIRGSPRPDGRPELEEELEIPYPLVALTISHVLRKTSSGHVLVFLPGWDEIQAVQRILVDPTTSLGFDFANRSKWQLHVLHSAIPLVDQQQIFETPPEGVRRVILSTNIAETSVTIPDVVYVVDTGKIKENRYDPDRHISALVSTWAGRSNLMQRAGRAGRHRPGSYYAILSKDRFSNLHSHQTVEMKRMDLSNVVMHVKALAFVNMDVNEVLAATIEPPEPDRVSAAIDGLKMVGALDNHENLTSLGRVLLQLPLDVHVGRLVLLGSFFKCLDQALTLAAILTNRDPFLSPPQLKSEAQAVKNSWSPNEYRSDALAVLRAYNAWWEMERRGDYAAATRFCSDNFLSKMTLLTISKIKHHLIQSVFDVGIIDVSAGGAVESVHSRSRTVPPELNENGDSLPLLAALIASAQQPKIAVRTSPKSYRTAQEKVRKADATQR
jgi:HrpA-like RNA helicase